MKKKYRKFLLSFNRIKVRYGCNLFLITLLILGICSYLTFYDIRSPQLTIVNPIENSYASGEIEIETAIKSYHPTYSVEVSIDNNPWEKMQKTSGNSYSGTYEYTWDSELLEDGPCNIVVKLLDTRGRKEVSQVTVFVENTNQSLYNFSDMNDSPLLEDDSFPYYTLDLSEYQINSNDFSVATEELEEPFIVSIENTVRDGDNIIVQGELSFNASEIPDLFWFNVTGDTGNLLGYEFEPNLLEKAAIQIIENNNDALNIQLNGADISGTDIYKFEVKFVQTNTFNGKIRVGTGSTVVLVYETTTNPTIDGQMLAGEWDSAFNATSGWLTDEPNNNPPPTDQFIGAYVMRNSTHVFVAFNSTDGSYNVSDFVMVYFDLDNDAPDPGPSFPDGDDRAFYIFRNGFSRAGQGKSVTAPPYWQANDSISWYRIRTDSTDYWTAEFAFPYSTLNLTSGEDKIIGIKFLIADADVNLPGEDNGVEFYWPPGGGNYIPPTGPGDSGDNPSSYADAYVDFNAPDISLNSPLENSLIKNPSVEATTIDLSITDTTNVSYAQYRWNSGVWTQLSSPYNIPITQNMYDNNLVDGTNTLTIWANDTLDNYQEISFNFEVDKISPIITLNSPLNETYQTSGTTVDISISDTYLDTVLYRWDSDSYAVFNSPYDTTIPAGDGQHDLYIYANDTSGNEDTEHYRFYTDDTPPDITINPPPSENSLIKPPSIEATTIFFTITDPRGVYYAQYKWNDGTWVQLFTPYDISITQNMYDNDLVDGTNTLTIWANDTLDNYQEISFDFEVDKTLPTITLNSPLNETYQTSGTTVDISVSDTYLDTVLYRWDSDSYAVFNSPYDTTIPIGDGWHDLYVYANDTSGNEVTEHFRFYTDDTPPVISNTQNEPDGSYPNTIQTQVTDSGSGVNPSEVQLHYWLSTDNATWGTEETPIVFNDLGGSDFVYDLVYSAPYLYVRYYIEAEDVLGNEQTDDNGGSYYFFTFDSFAPDITLNSPSENTLIKPPSIEATTINLSITDPSNVDYARYRWNSGSWTTLSFPYDIIITQSMYDNDLINGVNTLYLWSNDTIGNYQEVPFNFIVDKTIPTIILNSPLNETYQTSGTTVDISVSDTYLDTVLYRWDSDSYAVFNSPYDTIVPAGDGWHDLYVYANDTSGNEDTKHYRFYTDDSIPTLNWDSNNFVNDTWWSGQVTIDVDASDPELDAVWYRIFNVSRSEYVPGHNNITLLGPEFTITIDISGWHTEDIYYRVEVFASDLTGNEAQLININARFFRVDNEVPDLGGTEPESIPSEITDEMDVTVSIDETNFPDIGEIDLNNGIILRYSTNGGSTWISVTMTPGGSYVGTIPKQSAGTTVYYYIAVRDLAGNENTTSQYSYTVQSSGGGGGGGDGDSAGDGDGGDGGGGSSTTTKTMLMTLLTEVPNAVTQGTKVTVQFSLTDSSEKGIEGAIVSLTIGNSSITCTDLGNGIYSVTIDTSGISPGDYNVSISASKEDYESVTTTFTFTINQQLPLMIVGAGGVIAAGAIIGVILVLKNVGLIFSKKLASHYQKVHPKM